MTQPYRVAAAPPAAPPAREPNDEAVVSSVLIVVGVVPAVVSLIAGTPLGGEATFGLGLAVLGALGWLGTRR
jgi:hypothetical protein